MKKFIALVLISFITSASAQVPFQNISYKEALNRSNAEGKLIFLQIEGTGCEFCNEIADKSFSNQELAHQIEETFIPVKIGANHADRSTLMSQFNVKELGTLFINQSGVLIHAFRKTTSNAKDYKKQIDIALEKAGESLKINELETEYKRGNKTMGFLETLLLKRRSLNLSTEELLEEYVRLLPDLTVSVLPLWKIFAMFCLSSFFIESTLTVI